MGSVGVGRFVQKINNTEINFLILPKNYSQVRTTGREVEIYNHLVILSEKQ